MKRTAATLLLLAFAFFLAVAPWDECESSGQPCAAACHLFCSDGCANVPLAAAPATVSPPPLALAGLFSGVPAPGHHAYPPELPPPRA